MSTSRTAVSRARAGARHRPRPCGPDNAFSPEELITWISAYWFSGAIGRSFATYAESVTMPGRIRVPTVVSAFAHDTTPAPREWAEQFVEVVRFIEHADGGHFAAWGRPEQYAEDVLTAVGVARERGALQPRTC